MLHLPHWVCTADCQKVLVYQASRPPASVEPPATSDHLCTPEEEKEKMYCYTCTVEPWWKTSLMRDISLKTTFFSETFPLNPGHLTLSALRSCLRSHPFKLCACVRVCVHACVCMHACVCGCCWPVFQCASFVFVFSKLSFIDYVWFQLSVYCCAVTFLIIWGCLLKILFICC